MRIIQLTDLHIGKTDEYTYDIDVRQKFISSLEKARTYKPDLVVISGDFCYQLPHQEIYDWVIEQTQDYPIPIEVIAGNHDDATMLAHAFGKTADLHDDRIYFKRQIQGVDLLFLDTAPATMGDTQLEWLAQQLKTIKQPSLVFMHHPPFDCDIPFMDSKHAFKEQEKFGEVLQKHGLPMAIFCGHYHVEKTITKHNMTVNITPSTFYQLNQENIDFEVDHIQGGFRIIDILGEEIKQEVVYF